MIINNNYECDWTMVGTMVLLYIEFSSSDLVRVDAHACAWNNRVDERGYPGYEKQMREKEREDGGVRSERKSLCLDHFKRLNTSCC